jgi:hypothetical protein
VFAFTVVLQKPELYYRALYELKTPTNTIPQVKLVHELPLVQKQ